MDCEHIEEYCKHGFTNDEILASHNYVILNHNSKIRYHNYDSKSLCDTESLL